MNKKFEDPVGKPYEIPNAFLEQISEQCPDGYILFYIDQNGKPDIKANFNIPTMEMGLRAWASKFLQGINMVEEFGIAETIYEQSATDSEEDID